MRRSSITLRRLAFAHVVGCSAGCGAGLGPTVGIRGSGHFALGWQTHAEVTVVGAEFGQSFAIGAPTDSYLGAALLVPLEVPDPHQDVSQTLVGGRIVVGTLPEKESGRRVYGALSGIYGTAKRSDRTFTCFNLQLGVRLTHDGVEVFLAPSYDGFWLGPSIGNLSGMCAAAGTPIATPMGEVPIEALTRGDLVLSMHGRRLQAVPLCAVGRRAVRDHVMVQLMLEGGRTVSMSPGHPTADGRVFGELEANVVLGDARVIAVRRTPYRQPFTYDILPDSDTATYVAAGALVGSTLARANRASWWGRQEIGSLELPR